jgi:hypothetical protein
MNDSPKITTSDGGVIGASGITYDQNGNADGHVTTLTTQSWKEAYSVGPAVGALAVPFPSIAPVYSAMAGGSPTGTGTAVAVHSIGLFWCGAAFSGTCNGQTDANNLPESDLGFTYVPANSPKSKPQDFTSNSNWTNVIMSQAAKALSAAFTGVPVVSPNQPSPLGYFYKGTPDRVVNIVGDPIPAAGEGGITSTRCLFFGYICKWNSVVYYIAEMNGAQSASPNLYSPASPTQGLLTAIGIGIGNTAAHELGHQFQLPDMDCHNCALPPDKNPDPAFLYEYWQQEAPMYLDIGAPLTWDTNDIPVLNQQLFKK